MIPVEILDALKAAGATADMIVAAIKADQEIEERKRQVKRAKDAERKRRSRDVTRTERDGRGHGVTARDIADPPRSNTPPLEDTSSPPRGGSEGAKAPVYTDSTHELWGEGVPILRDLGMADRAARSFIGRCLKQARNDAQSVLGAIQRARDSRVIQPEAWITRSLQTNGVGNGENRQTGGATRKRFDASDFALEQLASYREKHGG